MVWASPPFPYHVSSRSLFLHPSATSLLCARGSWQLSCTACMQAGEAISGTVPHSSPPGRSPALTLGELVLPASHSLPSPLQGLQIWTDMAVCGQAPGLMHDVQLSRCQAGMQGLPLQPRALLLGAAASKPM